MACKCIILNQNEPLETGKFIVFLLEFVCFGDVSLDANFGQLGANLDQFLPNLGVTCCKFELTWNHVEALLGRLGPIWVRLGPT